MVDEALDVYVKATGRDGTQKRPELVNMRPGDLRRIGKHAQKKSSIPSTGLIVGGRESKEGRETIFFTHLSTRLGTIQTKKYSAPTFLSGEKNTITVSGKIVRTPSTGSNQPEHKTKD